MIKEGILLIDKPTNYTSRDIVNIISKELNYKKIGHTGTLDKSASGVLVLLIGKYTKLTNILVHDEKEYIVSFKLGFETTTLDLEGEVTKRSNLKKKNDEIIDTINSFLGFYDQEVPLYSSVHVNGKRLYKYAIKQERVDLPKRKVEIKKIEIINIKDDEITCKFLVSKGTYIRSLVRDIGNKLETYATVTSLKRTKEGIFNIKECNSLDDIRKGMYKIYDLHKIYGNDHFIELDDELYKKVSNGQKISLNKEKNYIVLTYNKEIIALYKKENQKYKMFIKFR